MKNQTKIAVAVFSWMALANLPVQAADKPIRPGRSIGSVALGATRAKVQKTLGKPSETASYKGGLTEDRWDSRLKTPAGFRHYMAVMFKGGKVIQIRVTSPEYTTPQGYSTATALSVWKQTYKKMRNVWHGYDFQPIPFSSDYHDAIQSGIAFVQSGRDDWEDSEPADAIIIHRSGQRVITQPGWTTVNSND
jgi:hypothetical protein